MTGEPRPLLTLGAPEVDARPAGSRQVPPRPSRPHASRQGERLTPQFRALVEAFDHRRATLSSARVGEIDPELVLVFDLAGSVKDFSNAINRIEGLEFLAEAIADDVEPDDDFHMVQPGRGRIDAAVPESLYLFMSNAAAAGQLVRLFDQWRADPTAALPHGLGKFKDAFSQLRAIRRWGPNDRVRDTGLLMQWQETLELVGQSVSSVMVEAELWHRRDPAERAAAESAVRTLVAQVGGQVRARAEIDPIGYHALLIELPIQQVQTVLRDGAGAIEILNTDELMFVSPFTPMTVAAPTDEPAATIEAAERPLPGGKPRIALLDGLPFGSHADLAGRLTIDDPDGVGEGYAAESRHHGTAMASLIIHGDLSQRGEPLARPLYVRPIMRPHPVLAGGERVVDGELLTDLVHRSIRRIVDGEAGRDPAAPSVRIVNLSIGADTRALVRRMSPLGRLLDWLAVEYNLLFVVSAGNHHRIGITIPSQAAGNRELAVAAALESARATARLRGILPPGDALNALTVGAAHADAARDLESSATVWDLTEPGAPALYGAVGPGVSRSIKPELFHSGGRALYVRPPAPSVGAEAVTLTLARTEATGPGNQVAAPPRRGASNLTVFTHGTSNATALVSREASRLFDLLERAADSDEEDEFPDPQFHPVLVKALLIHASSWNGTDAGLRRLLTVADTAQVRKELTTLLGYGVLNPARLANAATNRAVLVAAGSIKRDEQHIYRLPLPPSLRSRAEWHRFTVTLAYFAPTAGQLTRYRGTRIFFEALDPRVTGTTRLEADHNAARRGSSQHEIFDGSRAMVFADGESLPIQVVCMDDGQRLAAGKTVRYGIVVSVETAVTTSTTIHAEIQAQLQAGVRAQARGRASS